MKPESISGLPSRGDVSHLALGFQLCKKAFLGTSSIMEEEGSFCGKFLARDHGLVFENGFSGTEEIELNGAFPGLTFFLSKQKEPGALFPGLRFPGDIEERPFLVYAPPALPAFDDCFEFGEPLERDGGRELDAELFEEEQSLVAEMGGIEPGFENAIWQYGMGFLKGFTDEGVRPVGIVDVAGPLPGLEDLSCLGKRAEDGVVAPVALALFVEPDCRTLDVPAFGGYDGTVEVEGDTRKVFNSHPLLDHVRHHGPDLFGRTFIGVLEEPAQGGDGREFFQTDDTVYERIFFVVHDFPKPLPPQYEVDQDDEAEGVESVKGSPFEMAEARSQLLFQAERPEEFFEEDDSSKGREPLLFEPDFGLTTNGCFDIFPSRFHRDLSNILFSQNICGEIPVHSYRVFNLFFAFRNFTFS